MKRKGVKGAMNRAVTDYWLQFYSTDHCTVCGNTGLIDSRKVRTPAGYLVGRLNFCICPNGQAMRDTGKEPEHFA